MEKIPMTAAGHATLEAELKHCQAVERPRIIQQITDARTHGDLSENAEYHAAKVMAGEKLASFGLVDKNLDHVAVKEAVFPFARFPGVDTVLGPVMKSTGEVMGLDTSFDLAVAKSQIGGGTILPRTGTVFVSVRDADKPRILPAV